MAIKVPRVFNRTKESFTGSPRLLNGFGKEKLVDIRVVNLIYKLNRVKITGRATIMDNL